MTLTTDQRPEQVQTSFNYIEIAMPSPSRRGRVIPREKLQSLITPEYSVYRSTFLYDEAGLAYSREHASLKGYFGPQAIDVIPIDIDKEGDSHIEVQRRARAIVNELIMKYELSEDAYRIFYSGTGYHVFLHGDLFHFTPSTSLAYTVKNTILHLFPNIDPALYTRTSLYRVTGTPNGKSDLLKTPITTNELMSLPPEDIRKLAVSPRTDYEPAGWEAYGQLEKYVKEAVRPSMVKKVVDPSNVGTCYHTLWKRGPQTGDRHHVILRMVARFRKVGLPIDAAETLMLKWNHDSMNEDELLKMVENGYAKGYTYTCSDNLLRKYCNTKCIYYDKRNSEQAVVDADDMQKDLEQFVSTDFTGRTIPLGTLLGESDDIVIYPGELVAIYGPTGSNKTTLAHHIALGRSLVTGHIIPEAQLPTLYLSLELSPREMHHRSLQIVSGYETRGYIPHHTLVTLYEQYKDQITHIKVQTVAPSIKDIISKIREHRPKLVVVDYIDLIDTPGVRGEYEQVRHIAHSLSSVAVNEDIIVILLTQVSRQDAIEGLSVYSGKGGGAIENAGRKVIGIWGPQKTSVRQIEMFKSNRGELFGPTTVQLNNAYQFSINVDERARQIIRSAENE